MERKRMAENQKQNMGENVVTQIRREFGGLDLDTSKETIKTPLLTFRDGNVYLGLKIVSKYDPNTGIRKDPVPRITFSVNEKFMELPHNGEWWRNFADFTVKMAEAMDGVDISTSIVEADVGYAKAAMAKYRNKVA